MSAAGEIAVSVVIPTYNRPASLRRTLDALAVQTYPAERIEVIVVADGCTDGTAHMARDYPAGYTLRVLEQTNAGAAAARNHGAAAATGRLLVFLDDDVEPWPALVEAHVLAHASGGERVSLGPSLPVFSGRLDFFRMGLRAWWFDFFDAMHRPGHRFTFRSLAAGNCAIERALFARLGGFDPDIRNCGGEDWEFGMRVLKARVPFTYVHAARANHYDMSDLAQSFRRKRQEGQADVVMGRRHPELRPALVVSRLNRAPSRLSRALRGLAFAAPSAGDAAADRALQLLRVFERARLRRSWRSLRTRLNEYWYWRGVVDQLGSRRALANFLRDSSVQPDAVPELELDLGDGLRSAERRLDAERPAGARLHYRGQCVGSIPAEVGAEPLLGTHLRASLATVLSDRLLRVLAFQAATGSPLHPDWQPLVQSRAFWR